MSVSGYQPVLVVYNGKVWQATGRLVPELNCMRWRISSQDMPPYGMFAELGIPHEGILWSWGSGNEVAQALLAATALRGT